MAVKTTTPSAESRASTLVYFKDSVERAFRDFLPTGPDGVLHVATHVGEFGANEVKRYLTKAPAVILAPLGFPDIERAGGAVRFNVNYAAFVVVKHGKAGVDRNDAALAIVERIGLEVPFLAGGEACAQAPTNVEAGNLYTGVVDKMGMSLWAVRWRQVVQVPKLDDCAYDALPDFLRLVAEYNLDETDDPDDFDAEQQVDLPGPS